MSQRKIYESGHILWQTEPEFCIFYESLLEIYVKASFALHTRSIQMLWFLTSKVKICFHWVEFDQSWMYSCPYFSTSPFFFHQVSFLVVVSDTRAFPFLGGRTFSYLQPSVSDFPISLPTWLSNFFHMQPKNKKMKNLCLLTF